VPLGAPRPEPFQLGMFTIMFALNWQLSPIVLATPPLLLYALFYLYRKIKVLE
jgi:hypothetical protein